MKKFYDHRGNRLVFVSHKASPVFWDQHWSTSDLKQTILRGAANKFYTNITRRYLSPSKKTKVLDGGCGRGEVVYALSQAGYNAHGVDFAKHTAQGINQTMPHLSISYGNITQLDFPDNYFDGYWSLGVIEHYYHGYQNITREMYRVINRGGYLFITYPYLSPLRKIKIALGSYPSLKTRANEPSNFYQFALDKNTVTRDLSALGFILKYQRPVDGFKGLRDEVSLIQPLLRKINTNPAAIMRYLRAAIAEVATPISGHIMLQVFKKQ